MAEIDLISRQDALNCFHAWVDKNGDVYTPDDMPEYQAIEALPSAQRTGEWLRYGEDGNPNEEDTVFWQCDQCLETYTGRTTRIPNYCPNCGADMRGDNNETD